MSYLTKTHQMDNFMVWASHMRIRENRPPGKLASWKNGLLENLPPRKLASLKFGGGVKLASFSLLMIIEKT